MDAPAWLRDDALADLFEEAPIALHFVGPDGTILRANRAELDLLGYTADEYIGRNIAEIHADRPAVEDILCRLSSGETLHNYEARLRHKSGEIRYVLITSNARFADGRFLYTRCFTRDITDRTRAEEARAQARAMARLAAQLQIAREDERRYIAKQMHDELISGLTVAAMDLHNVLVQLRARGDPLAQNLEMVMRLLSASVDTKRRIIETLTPTILHELGLGAALKQVAQRFTARTGIVCGTEIDPQIVMDGNLGLVLYRTAQEGLDIVAAHTGATRADIALKAQDGRAVLTVSGDGQAVASAGTEDTDQLQGCRQLLAGWGGGVTVDRGASGHPLLHAVVPLPEPRLSH